MGGATAFGIAYVVEQLIDVSELGATTTTVVSVATVVLGTAAFVGIVVLSSGLLYTWLFERKGQPAESAGDRQ